MSRLHTRFGMDDGQQTVELALVFPVFMLTVLVLVNMMLFISECARFDRVAGQVARSGVTVPSPDLDQKLSERLNDGLGYKPGGVFQASVVHAGLNKVTGQFLVDYEKVTCTLTYYPWPAGRTFDFGKLGRLTIGAPLTHQHSLVIDHYMPGAIF